MFAPRKVLRYKHLKMTLWRDDFIFHSPLYNSSIAEFISLYICVSTKDQRSAGICLSSKIYESCMVAERGLPNTNAKLTDLPPVHTY